MEPLGEDLKTLFITWVEQSAIEATQKNSKAALLYNRALFKLREHQGPIDDPKTLKQIQFVGEKTVKSLTDKLQKYCAEKGVGIPKEFATKPAEQPVLNASDQDQTAAKKPRKKRRYVPRHRSGGFAIMIALYVGDKNRRGLRKEEIIKRAEPFADKSFTSNPSANEFYSAWSSIKVLMTNDLVSCSGRPKVYMLTDEGLELAANLKDTVGITSSPAKEQPEYDASFDNNVLVSPDTSYVNQKRTPSKTFDKNANAQSPVLMNTENEFTSPLAKRVNENIFISPDSRKTKENSPENDLEAIQSIQVQFDLPASDNLPNKRQKLSPTKPTIQSDIHDPNSRVFNNTKYDVWPADEYEVILLIDTREIRSQQERDFFQTRLANLNIKCEVRALTVGDTLWIAKHKQSSKEVVLNFICERKKLDDLAMSIKDGRFQEQKNRLKKTGMKHFYYVVEESGSDNVGDMMDAIKTALSMTMTVSEFYLRKFKDVDDTIQFLASITQVIQEQHSTTKLIVLRPKSVETQTEYRELLESFRWKFEENRETTYECVHLFPTFQDVLGKTGMMTVKEMFILMLMAIRGVSLERAIVIQNRFPTPRSLIEFYNVHHNLSSEQEKRKLLELEFLDQVGNKKIGKVCSENVYDIWGSMSA